MSTYVRATLFHESGVLQSSVFFHTWYGLAHRWFGAFYRSHLFHYERGMSYVKRRLEPGNACHLAPQHDRSGVEPPRHTLDACSSNAAYTWRYTGSGQHE